MILWLDLETTGTNEEKDDIIEVGMVLTEANAAFTQVAEYSRVYKTTVPISDIEPHVWQMHTDSGLWRDMFAHAKLYADQDLQGIMDWLGRCGALKHDLPLAGSGVAHFDRRFIETAWPALAKRLTYWSYDIGSVRRFARLADRAFGPEVERREMPGVDLRHHRALADTYDAITEARELLKALRT